VVAGDGDGERSERKGKPKKRVKGSNLPTQQMGEVFSYMK
jgi:hypothetical protein